MGSNKSNRILVLDYKKEISHTEIDLDLIGKAFPKYADEDSMNNYPRIVRKGKDFSWSGEQEPIPLEDVQKTLNKFKSIGCTHIEIMHHSDHNGYYFYGIIASVADKNEVARIQKIDEIEHKKLLKEKRKELEAEIKAINKQLQE